ncbi:ligase [Photobacterium frigidiphilum]|uniref:Ligase n=1 Tax=Photobacterium frigidiphilum TaxID=264736 RepID=A0A2T3JLF2_9GAMM|nr:O-antigen ligase family protein [Photobacterium frigidiphilum]PSU49839.1 ligase [Photobacterium frigidiphilum]
MNKANIFKLLMLLPYIWLSTGLLVLRNSDKTMIIMMVIAIIATLIHRGLAPIKENLRNDKTLWLLLVITGYALFSYYYHGGSSREIRALIGASLFLICFPRELLTQKVLLGLTLLGSSLCLAYACYYNLYLNVGRSNWPINAIPFATMCAVFGVLAIAQLSRTSSLSVRLQAILALTLSLTGVIFTETRGIWLGFTITAAIILLLKVKNKGINWKYATIGLTAFLSIGFMAKPQLEQRIEQTQAEVNAITSGNLNTSIGLRFQMWKLAPDMLQDNYILGLGDRHALRFDELYKLGFISKELFNFKPAHYHNQYLDKLIKNGVFGLLLFLVLIIVPITQVKYVSTNRKYKIIGIVSLFAIASLTDVPFNHGQTLSMYLLLICGLINYNDKEKSL